MATAKYHRIRSTVANQRTGYGVNAHIADIDELDSVAVPAASPASQSEIPTDHTATAPAGFVKCYTIPGKTEMEGSTFGDAGALNDMYKVKLFFPGDDVATQDMLKEILNKNLLVMVEDATSPDGPVWQLGSEKLPANVVANSFASGTVYQGEKGYSIEVQSSERFKYSGTIPLQT